jgi:hypothetical protein
MKMAFVVCTEYFVVDVMQLLRNADIDYYTRWDHAKGKGRGTEPHLGSGSHGSTNTVLMIAFDEDEPLERLIGLIGSLNAKIARRDDRVRLFQLPLERIV